MLLSKSGSADFQAVIASLATQSDPVGLLVQYLQAQRVPPQGRIFYSQTITGIAIHTGIIACVALCTFTRWRIGACWFTRRQQGRVRLNATVIAMILAAVYSALALAYTAMLLYQQSLGRYLYGSAGFELSCFAAISFCVSVICFTYYQSLPVGFESKHLRKLFRRGDAATDARVFDLPLLCIWLVFSLTGLMVAPIVHDYWRRQADSTVAAMIQYLQDPKIQQEGMVALLGIADQANVLEKQMDNAIKALRVQVLVYLCHAILFLCIIAPVAYKLISLLNNQIYSLQRAAEDFFLGSRMDATKSQLGQTQSQIPLNPTQSMNRIPRKPVPAEPHAHGITCDNCQTEVAVRFENAVYDKEKGYSPNSTPTFSPYTPASAQPKRLQPRFLPPSLPLHSGYPLIRAKKLQKVRLELVAFSSITVLALLAFSVACICLYIRIPHWSAGDVIVGFYTICLWCYAIPVICACGIYVYTTMALPRTGSSVASTPTSRSSAASTEKIGLRKITNMIASMGKMEKTDEEGTLANGNLARPPPAIITKRTQPSFPRAVSVTSFGMTTDAGRTERTDANTDSESVFVPPVPTLVRSGSRIKKWIDQEGERFNANLLGPAPPPSVASVSTRAPRKPRKHSMGPVSQTQSWLDIDEEE